jgi:hypothetical protein
MPEAEVGKDVAVLVEKRGSNWGAVRDDTAAYTLTGGPAAVFASLQGVLSAGVRKLLRRACMHVICNTGHTDSEQRAGMLHLQKHSYMVLLPKSCLRLQMDTFLHNFRSGQQLS